MGMNSFSQKEINGYVTSSFGYPGGYFSTVLTSTFNFGKTGQVMGYYGIQG